MSDLFNIWNPYLVTPTILSVDVTPDETGLLDKGSSALISDCLRVCGVSAAAVDWQVRCVRQSYYSDYLQSDDWRARWDIGWIIQIALSHPVHLQGTLRPFPYKTSVPDETAENNEPTLASGSALLIACFPSSSIEPMVNEVVSDWASRTGIAFSTPLQWHSFGRWLRLRGIVESLKFPDNIPDLEGLQAGFRRAGGLTNRQDLLGDF
jgi:hypothetical protein